MLTKAQLLQAYTDSGGAGPFFTSDLHFHHSNICKFEPRPWTTDTQTAKLIERWNERVGWEDDVYHLGDFSFLYRKGVNEVVDVLKQLHGRIHLIRGNHCDELLWGLIEDLNLPFIQWLKHYHEMSVQGQKIVLCHYPMETWNGAAYGSWMLHGHCHGHLPPRGKRLDVGIDNHPDYRIFSYAEVAAIMATQKIAVVDHHGRER